MAKGKNKHDDAVDVLTGMVEAETRSKPKSRKR
jgi:hypothetical protein